MLNPIYSNEEPEDSFHTNNISMFRPLQNVVAKSEPIQFSN